MPAPFSTLPKQTLYTHTTTLLPAFSPNASSTPELTHHPSAVLHSLIQTSPQLTLRTPTAKDIPALKAILRDPANMKDDLSVASLDDVGREEMVRGWVELGPLIPLEREEGRVDLAGLKGLNFVVCLRDNREGSGSGVVEGKEDIIGIAGLGWIGPITPPISSTPTVPPTSQTLPNLPTPSPSQTPPAQTSPPPTSPSPNNPNQSYAGAAGILLSPPHRGKGLAFTSLAMVIDYGLRELGLREVRIGTTSRNVGMRGLMERKFGWAPTREGESDRFGNDLLWVVEGEVWGEWIRQREATVG